MLHRVFQYAQPHTRTRARIGVMPGQAQWQHIAAARDVDTMIQRMRDNGLARWVTPLPRSPDARALEYSLQQGVLALVNDVCRWLPSRWRNVRQWLQSGASLALLPELLSNPDYQPPEGSPEALRQIAAQSLELREDALRLTDFGRYLHHEPAASLAAWLHGFDAACPALRGVEARTVNRIRRLIRSHVANLREHRLLVRNGGNAESSQWRMHAQLADRLRALLGYESFHAGVLMIYALLELLQCARCRALLLARINDWDAAGVV